MPRKARQKSITDIYHVVIRGMDRQRIFEDHNDFEKYLDILSFYQTKYDFELYAYCLMDNHIHLLLCTPTASLSCIFHQINTTYAVWFNMKYDRTGALQQGRFYSEPVENISYLLKVVRYIHQNPWKAGLEKLPGTTYRWSSMHIYQNTFTNSPSSTTTPIIQTQNILILFGGYENFYTFHKLNTSDNCLEIRTIRKRLPDDVARKIMETECNCYCTTDFQKLSLIERNQNLILLHKKGISIRQLNRLTGIPKGVIERMVKKSSPTD